MDTVQNVVAPTIYCILAVVGITGNGLVLYIMGAVVKSKSVTDVYVTNLAIADLLFVSTLPFLANELFTSNWVFGEAFCKILSAISYINMYGSIFFLTAMGIDRWLAVVQAVKSRKSRTVRRAWINSAIVWVVCLVFTIFPLAFRTVEEVRDGRKRCKWHFPAKYIFALNIYYSLSRTLIGFVIPLSIIIFCYVSILCFMKRRSRLKGKKYKGLSRITKMVALIIVCFVIAWLPNQVTNFIHFLKSIGAYEYCPRPVAIVGGTNFTDTESSGGGSIEDYSFSTAAPMWPSTTESVFGSTLEIATSPWRYRRDLNPLSAASITTFLPYGTPFQNNATTSPDGIEATESSITACIRKISRFHIFFVCLGFANSITNPFVYAFFGSSLRMKLARMCQLKKRNSRLRRTVMRTATFSTFFRSTEGERSQTKRARRASVPESATARLRLTSDRKAEECRRASHQTTRLSGGSLTTNNCPQRNGKAFHNAEEEPLTKGVVNGEIRIDKEISTSEPSDELFGGVWVG